VQGFSPEWRDGAADDPERLGKRTSYAKTGKAGRPSKVVAVDRGRPRDTSFPTAEELADPAIYARYKARYKDAVDTANLRKLQLERVRETEDKLRSELQAMRAELERLADRKMAVPPHLSTWIDAVMMAAGVSANLMPFVAALEAIRWTGTAEASDIKAVSTYAATNRTAGAALRTDLAVQIQGRCIFVQSDQSGRAGLEVSSTTVSVWDLRTCQPLISFAGLDILPDKKAETITASVIGSVETLRRQCDDSSEDSQLDIAGFGSDSTASMTGSISGVGVRLAAHCGYFMRHDTCGEHIHALLQHCFAIIFGDAKINEISVMQWLYLVWYVCNKNWPLVRASMLHVMADNSEEPVEPPHLEDQLPEPQPEDLTKCTKPNSIRWGSVPACAFWIERWLAVLLRAFTFIWQHSSDCAPGSLAGLVGQWVQWSRSPQLAAQFQVLLAWADLLALSRDRLHETTPHGFRSCFGAPGRLQWYCDLNTAIKRWMDFPETFPAYAALCAVYPLDGAGAWRRLGDIAEDCIERRMLYLWSGVYSLDGFANPATTSTVLEALLYRLQADGWPAALESCQERCMKLMELAFTERDPLSEELQEWLCHDLSDLHQEAWDALLTADFVEGLLRCYSILRHRGERAFLDEFLAPEPVCPVVKYFQYRVFPCVTVTTFLESTFNSLNQVSGPHHLLVKKDASEAAHAHGRIDTIRSLVNVRGLISTAVAEASRTYQDARGLTHAHLSQAKDVYVAAAQQVVKNAPSEGAVRGARSKRSVERPQWRRPKGRISGSDQSALDVLLEAGVQRRDPNSLQTAPVPPLVIMSLCFADGRCAHERKKTRGRQSYIGCQTCNMQFHSSCVKAANLPHADFYCGQASCAAPAADMSGARVDGVDAEVDGEDGDDAVALAVCCAFPNFTEPPVVLISGTL